MNPGRALAHIARCAALIGLLLAGSGLRPIAVAQPHDFVPGAGDRSGSVHVGQGREIYLECSGAGSPRMLISGAGVAAYDRPGAEQMGGCQPFDYLGIGDAVTYWPQWLQAAAMLSTSLRATHLTQTNSDHFIENENPALVVGQICAVAGPKHACPTG